MPHVASCRYVSDSKYQVPQQKSYSAWRLRRSLIFGVNWNLQHLHKAKKLLSLLIFAIGKQPRTEITPDSCESVFDILWLQSHVPACECDTCDTSCFAHTCELEVTRIVAAGSALVSKISDVSDVWLPKSFHFPFSHLPVFEVATPSSKSVSGCGWAWWLGLTSLTSMMSKTLKMMASQIFNTRVSWVFTKPNVRHQS